MDIEAKLKEGNLIFQEKMEGKSLLNERLIKGQNPFAIVVTCSDSRVIPEEIFSVSLGELFVIRSAGNVINEGELASIEYGIHHLHIDYVLVLAHTLCGAVHAAIHDEKGMYLAPILSKIKEVTSINKDERQTSIDNAIKQVEYIKNKFPDYKGTIEAGLYDIATNSVLFIDK